MMIHQGPAGDDAGLAVVPAKDGRKNASIILRGAKALVVLGA